MGHSRVAVLALAVASAIYWSCSSAAAPAPEPSEPLPITAAVPVSSTTPTNANAAQPPRALPPLPAFVEKGLDWLAGAQQANGGWGAGSSARQDVRDAHAVPTDPATTAVAAMALMRAGNSTTRGHYAAVLGKATDYLLAAVESAPDDGPRITDLTGTQPQAKMGQNVDTALTAQFFARLLQEDDLAATLQPRVQKALDKCLRKIETAQSGDGGWEAGGWAPVLQSAQMCTAMELAQAAGRPIDADKLAKAREYQRGQVAQSAPAVGGGSVATFSARKDAAAGVDLYAYASNMRSVAADAKAAENLVEVAKNEGRIDRGAKVDAATLQKLGVKDDRAAALVDSFAMNEAAKTRAFDENMLQGFGNNGGEEFLSYQMKSEALAIDGGEEQAKWMAKMGERLAKVQNTDGSWTGHHCITSPTFCTATALSCLTAERDVDWLRKTTQLAAK